MIEQPKEIIELFEEGCQVCRKLIEEISRRRDGNITLEIEEKIRKRITKSFACFELETPKKVKNRFPSNLCHEIQRLCVYIRAGTKKQK